MKVRTIATLLVGLTALAASCVAPDGKAGTTEASASVQADGAYTPIHGWVKSN